MPYEVFLKTLERLREDEEYEMEAYMRLSFFTGCRYSDVSRITWGDIIGKSELTIAEKKTGKTRRIVINPTVQRKMRELYELMGRPSSDWLIAGNPDDPTRPLSISSMNRRLKVVRCNYRLPVKNMSTHTLRKTFGRYVFERGGCSAESLILLSKIFRHSSIQMTENYIGLDSDAIDEVYNEIAF